MSNRTFILYSALKQLSRDHYRVFPCGPAYRQPLFIRAELVHCDHNEAMDRIKPMEGETFLNCVPAE